MDVPYLNVVNAAKSLARSLMRGVNPRHKTAWKTALARLTPKQRWLVQMVRSLEVHEKLQKGDPKNPSKTSRGHLRVVK